MSTDIRLFENDVFTKQKTKNTIEKAPIIYIYIYFLYILIYIFIHVYIYIERKIYHVSSLHFLHRRTLESRERT